MMEHRDPYAMADGGAGSFAISSRAARTAVSLPTEVCIECGLMVRLGNHLVSYVTCDDCAPDFLERNREAALARAEVAA